MKAGGTPRSTFLDKWFDKVRTVPVKPTETAGAAGTQTYGGVIRTRERNRNLVGVERYRVYGEHLRNVWVVAVGVRHHADLVSKPEWTVEPADKSRAAKEVAERLEKCIKDLATPLNRAVRKMSMMRFFGFSIFEWTAKKLDDGTIGILDLESRPQVTIEGWDLDKFGVVHGVAQRMENVADLQYIPREKLLHFVDDAFTDSPEGFGLLRSAVADIDILQSYERFEGTGFETDLQGIPIGKLPLADLRAQIGSDGFTQQHFDAYVAPFIEFITERSKSNAKGFYHDSATYVSKDGAQTPSSVPRYGIELMTGGQAAFEAIGKAIERKTHYLACLFQVEHLLIGGANRGSQALSKDKSTNYGITCDSTLAEIRHTLQIDFVRTWMKLNGIDKKLEPLLKVGKTQWRDIEQITAALRDVSVAGLMPGDPAVDEIRDLLGLSRVPEELLQLMEEDAALRRAAAVAPPPAPGAKPGAPTPPGGPKAGTPKKPGAPIEKPDNQKKNGEKVDPKARAAKAFDPDQPRGDDGKWSSDGGGGGGDDDDDSPVDVAPSKEWTSAQADYDGAFTKWTQAQRDVKARRITRAQFNQARADFSAAVDAIDKARDTENAREAAEEKRIRQERKDAKAPKDDSRQGRLFKRKLEMDRDLESESRFAQVMKAFDPDQARDEGGKWTSDGGGAGGSSSGNVTTSGHIHQNHGYSANYTVEQNIAEARYRIERAVKSYEDGDEQGARIIIASANTILHEASKRDAKLAEFGLKEASVVNEHLGLRVNRNGKTRYKK